MVDTPKPFLFTTSDEARALSDIEADMLSTYDHQLKEMAQAAVDEGMDVEAELADLVETLPDAARTEIVKRFREIVASMREAKGMTDTLTPEQEQQLELLKAYEQHYIAHMLSDKALEKIRRMLLSNPGLMQQILGMGENLIAKGVFTGRVPQDVLMDSITSTQPQQTPDVKKPDGKDSGRGR